MKNITNRLLQVKEEIETSANEVLRLSGKKEELENMIDKELKKHNVVRKDVKKFLEELKADIERIENDVSTALEALEEKYV